MRHSHCNNEVNRVKKDDEPDSTTTTTFPTFTASESNDNKKSPNLQLRSLLDLTTTNCIFCNKSIPHFNQQEFLRHLNVCKDGIVNHSIVEHSSHVQIQCVPERESTRDEDKIEVCHIGNIMSSFQSEELLKLHGNSLQSPTISPSIVNKKGPKQFKSKCPLLFKQLALPCQNKQLISEENFSNHDEESQSSQEGSKTSSDDEELKKDNEKDLFEDEKIKDIEPNGETENSSNESTISENEESPIIKIENSSIGEESEEAPDNESIADEGSSIAESDTVLQCEDMEDESFSENEESESSKNDNDCDVSEDTIIRSDESDYIENIPEVEDSDNSTSNKRKSKNNEHGILNENSVKYAETTSNESSSEYCSEAIHSKYNGMKSLGKGELKKKTFIENKEHDEKCAETKNSSDESNSSRSLPKKSEISSSVSSPVSESESHTVVSGDTKSSSLSTDQSKISVNLKASPSPKQKKFRKKKKRYHVKKSSYMENYDSSNSGLGMKREYINPGPSWAIKLPKFRKKPRNVNTEHLGKKPCHPNVEAAVYTWMENLPCTIKKRTSSGKGFKFEQNEPVGISVKVKENNIMQTLLDPGNGRQSVVRDSIYSNKLSIPPKTKGSLKEYPDFNPTFAATQNHVIYSGSKDLQDFYTRCSTYKVTDSEEETVFHEDNEGREESKVENFENDALTAEEQTESMNVNSEIDPKKLNMEISFDNWKDENQKQSANRTMEQNKEPREDTTDENQKPGEGNELNNAHDQEIETTESEDNDDMLHMLSAMGIIDEILKFQMKCWNTRQRCLDSSFLNFLNDDKYSEFHLSPYAAQPKADYTESREPEEGSYSSTNDITQPENSGVTQTTISTQDTESYQDRLQLSNANTETVTQQIIKDETHPSQIQSRSLEPLLEMLSPPEVSLIETLPTTEISTRLFPPLTFGQKGDSKPTPHGEQVVPQFSFPYQLSQQGATAAQSLTVEQQDKIPLQPALDDTRHLPPNLMPSFRMQSGTAPSFGYSYPINTQFQRSPGFQHQPNCLWMRNSIQNIPDHLSFPVPRMETQLGRNITPQQDYTHFRTPTFNTSPTFAGFSPFHNNIPSHTFPYHQCSICQNSQQYQQPAVTVRHDSSVYNDHNFSNCLLCGRNYYDHLFRSDYVSNPPVIPPEGPRQIICRCSPPYFHCHHNSDSRSGHPSCIPPPCPKRSRRNTELLLSSLDPEHEQAKRGRYDSF